MSSPTHADVIIVGAGHNGLVAAILLARAGLEVIVLEEKDTVGGACKTERPFKKAPKMPTSTGAYLLGLPPPELLELLGVSIPLIRRDPHYFVPTTGHRYRGSNGALVLHAISLSWQIQLLKEWSFCRHGIAREERA